MNSVRDVREERFVRCMRRLSDLLDQEPERAKAEAVAELDTLLRIGRHSGLTEERTIALLEGCVIEAVRLETDLASA